MSSRCHWLTVLFCCFELMSVPLELLSVESQHQNILPPLALNPKLSVENLFNPLYEELSANTIYGKDYSTHVGPEKNSMHFTVGL